MDFLYDEAAPADRRVVEAHLDECGDCRTEMRAFRRVREDLLAWEVPAYESVWTPFAPTPVAVEPWYRQVPAWAMATAAGLMLLLGSAGGFAASALTAKLAAQAPIQLATVQPTVTPAPVPVAMTTPVPIGLSDEEIVQLVQAEMAKLSAGRTLVANQAEALVAAAASEQWGRLQDYLTAVAHERELERRNTEQTLGGLRAQVLDLQTAVNFLAEQKAKGQQ
jgi:hypothetical protein